MQIVIIRHAEAVVLGDRGTRTDEDRMLTDAGHAQCPPVARSLNRLGVRIDRILVSPLVRARETAEGVLAAWNGRKPTVALCNPLAPGGKKRQVLEAVLAVGAECVAVVGHNPDLSELVGWFIGDKRAGIDMEKAGVALIDFDGQAAKGTGTLRWLVGPEWCV